MVPSCKVSFHSKQAFGKQEWFIRAIMGKIPWRGRAVVCLQGIRREEDEGWWG